MGSTQSDFLRTLQEVVSLAAGRRYTNREIWMTTARVWEAGTGSWGRNDRNEWGKVFTTFNPGHILKSFQGRGISYTFRRLKRRGDDSHLMYLITRNDAIIFDHPQDMLDYMKKSGMMTSVRKLGEADTEKIVLYKLNQEVTSALKATFRAERSIRDEERKHGVPTIWDPDSFLPNGSHSPPRGVDAHWIGERIGPEEQGKARIVRKKGSTIELEVTWYFVDPERKRLYGFKHEAVYRVDVREKDLVMVRFQMKRVSNHPSNRYVESSTISEADLKKKVPQYLIQQMVLKDLKRALSDERLQVDNDPNYYPTLSRNHFHHTGTPKPTRGEWLLGPRDEGTVNIVRLRGDVIELAIRWYDGNTTTHYEAKVNVDTLALTGFRFLRQIQESDLPVMRTPIYKLKQDVLRALSRDAQVLRSIFPHDFHPDGSIVYWRTFMIGHRPTIGMCKVVRLRPDGTVELEIQWKPDGEESVIHFRARSQVGTSRIVEFRFDKITNPRPWATLQTGM